MTNTPPNPLARTSSAIVELARKLERDPKDREALARAQADEVSAGPK